METSSGARMRIFQEIAEETQWGLIPLNGKVPVVVNWQQWCVTKRPFNPKDFEGRNAGIPCGPGNGVIALDVDDLQRFNAYLKKNNLQLPETRTHMTGTGKPHYFYGYPADGEIYRNRSLRDQGFDIRGLGGQVVCPGSIHPDTKKPYTVRHSGPITEPPEWLKRLARRSSDEEKTDDAGPQGAAPAPEILKKLPYAARRLVEKGEVKGRRSEAIMSAINALTRAGASDSQTIEIFEAYPIGEKYREVGATRERWLQAQIQKARADRQSPGNGGGACRAISAAELIKHYDAESESFLWRTHIPRGCAALLVGREGSGKTSVALQISSEILDADQSAHVIWVACEGHVANTLTKISSFGGALLDGARFLIAQKSDGTYNFDFSKPQERLALEGLVQTNSACLVVVDSLGAATPYAFKDDMVGKCMTSLNAVICDKQKAALIYIHHMNKTVDAELLNRSAGSVSITAAVRIVLSILPKGKLTRRITADAKSNLITPSCDLLTIMTDQGIVFQEIGPTEQNQSTQAEEFLTKIFTKKREIEAADLFRQAEAAGLNVATIKKCKGLLDIQSHKRAGVWIWSLPTTA